MDKAITIMVLVMVGVYVTGVFWAWITAEKKLAEHNESDIFEKKE